MEGVFTNPQLTLHSPYYIKYKYTVVNEFEEFKLVNQITII